MGTKMSMIGEESGAERNFRRHGATDRVTQAEACGYNRRGEGSRDAVDGKGLMRGGERIGCRIVGLGRFGIELSTYEVRSNG